MNTEPDIFESLGDEAPDIGCAAGFELLHRYVESGLDGGDPAEEFPGLATHLDQCPACRSDYEGLIDAAQQFGDADPR